MRSLVPLSGLRGIALRSSDFAVRLEAMASNPDRRTWTNDAGASMRGVRRADGQWLVRFAEGHPQAWAELACIGAADVRAGLVTNRPGDQSAVHDAALREANFLPGRYEQSWRIPVAGLPRVTFDTPHDFVPVDELDLEAVARLDNAIRADIPGTENWHGTAADLQETLDDPEFDSALYLVARHVETGSLDGLIRVWNRAPAPRLGCIGVARPWRRTRLAAALIRAVGVTLRERRVEEIMTETDQLNTDSYAMAAHHGGIKSGTLVEWTRPP